MTDIDNNATRIDEILRIGQEMGLNDQTPQGLFEDGEGNRYIISAEPGDSRLAIVLRHRFLEIFTWFYLPRLPIVFGRWWGSYRIRMTSNSRVNRPYLVEGTISLVGETLSIDCLHGPNGNSVMPLADLCEDAGGCDADGWQIEACQAPFRFCAQSRPGKHRYGPTPPETAEIANRDLIVELDPKSVLRFRS